ncbi:MAG: Holliday junction branch migration protein RuvA [Firmicutes bacterium]|mgnify:CR=1 FL=1|nr:Holliday junction branch migration protein RuvA [Bacillota bacterium]
MIRYVKGIYSMNINGGIVVETQSGLGLEIFLPANSPIYRYGEGETIMVYTSMIVKEDDISLYGFHNRDNLEIFERLITVSGVGAKGAMSILSTLEAAELKRAIAFEDAKEISRANGIGKKTAERIILELKDKLAKTDIPAYVPPADTADVSSDSRSEAITALVALGYTKAEAFNAVASINDEGLSSEEYIKKALKNLF